MEDFHCEHLSDEQMKELNPIIRNAIYTGLHAISCMKMSKAAESYVNFQKMLIPGYWEQPELVSDFVRSVKLSDSQNYQD
ncbi:MAG: hypothetical protein PHT33_12180, partial [bacterium]|nr:hypothetical protein [bacterium]